MHRTRSVLHVESLALIKGAVQISREEAKAWIEAHRDEPIDALPAMLMVKGYGANDCQEYHCSEQGRCDCFTQLTDGDVWELDERTGKPVIAVADWWGPFELWKA